MDINFVLKDPRGQGLASDCIPQFWEKSRVGGSKIVSMQLSRRFPIGSRYSDQSIIYNSFRTTHDRLFGRPIAYLLVFEGGGEHRARAPPTPRALALHAPALAPTSPSDFSRPRASRSGARAPEGGGPLR